MALPFLRKKQVAGLIMAKRKPDGNGMEETGNAPEPSSHPLASCAADLMSAISAGDQEGVAAALQAAIDISNSQPSEMPEEIV